MTSSYEKANAKTGATMGLLAVGTIFLKAVRGKHVSK